MKYRIAAPIKTHRRKATCKEVDCPHFLIGWKTVLDESKPRHMRVIEWLRAGKSGLHFKEERDVEGLVAFTFPRGQRCFYAPHSARLEREAVYTRQGEVLKQEHFTEAWNEDMYAVKRVQERG